MPRHSKRELIGKGTLTIENTKGKQDYNFDSNEIINKIDELRKALKNSRLKKDNYSLTVRKINKRKQNPEYIALKESVNNSIKKYLRLQADAKLHGQEAVNNNNEKLTDKEYDDLIKYNEKLKTNPLNKETSKDNPLKQKCNLIKKIINSHPKGREASQPQAVVNTKFENKTEEKPKEEPKEEIKTETKEEIKEIKPKRRYKREKKLIEETKKILEKPKAVKPPKNFKPLEISEEAKKEIRRKESKKHFCEETKRIIEKYRNGETINDTDLLPLNFYIEIYKDNKNPKVINKVKEIKEILEKRNKS